MIKIFFHMNTKFLNNYEKLFKHLSNFQEYDCLFIASDCFVNNKLFISQEDIEDILRARDLPFVSELNRKTGELLNYRSEAPSIIFFQTPYPETRKNTPHPSILNRHSKIYYISYGFTLVDYNDAKYKSYFSANSFFSYCDAIFVENITIKNYLNKFIPEKCYAIGYLKSAHINLNVNSKVEMRTPIIAWKPRWTLSFEDSGFLKYLFYLLDYCELNKGFFLKIFAHPLLLKSTLSNPLLGKNFISILRMRINKLDNVMFHQLDQDEDHDELLSSDLLISDLSSTVVDFLMTGKPVILTKTETKLNPFGIRVTDSVYHVSNMIELTDNINKLISGIDPLENKRKESLNFLSESELSGNFIEPEIIIKNQFIDSLIKDRYKA